MSIQPTRPKLGLSLARSGFGKKLSGRILENYSHPPLLKMLTNADCRQTNTQDTYEAKSIVTLEMLSIKSSVLILRYLYLRYN